MTENDEAKIASDLVSRIRGGDKEAEKLLVSRYQRGLYFILRKQCQYNEALTQDLVQETWVVVLTKVRDNAIRDPSKLASYIIQTGKNIVIAHFRKQANKKENFVSIAEATNLYDRTAGPEQIVEHHNIMLVVKQLILEFEKTRDRDILYRYFLNGQEKPLVCHALDLSAGYFDKVLHRAKNRLVELCKKQNIN